jgi:predicted double-glycine peptidase
MKARGLTIALILLGTLPAPVEAITFQMPGQTLLNVPVRSLVELRFKNVVRQAHDISCGAAALATLLKYYYAEEVTEREAIEAMLALGDREKIQKEGFSLLEMKWFAEKKGYVATGYRINDVNNLNKLKIPAITVVKVRGYAHFVVIKGVADGQVFIADPAFGNRSRPLEGFDREWNKVILVVLHSTRTGSSAFTLDPTLRVRASDVMLFLDQNLQSIAPAAGEF